LNDFLSYLLIDKKYSNNTIISYKKDLNQYLEFINNKKITNVDELDALEYIKKITKSGLNARSLSRNISTLRSFYKYLMIEKVVDKSPFELIELPKIGKKLPKVLSSKDIDLLLSYRN
jgi:integrase/recombinase XerD